MDNNKSDFSVGKVSGHIVNLAVPMTIAQLVQVIYSLVDRIYIGHLSSASALALTGLGLTFPIVIIIMAFTNLFGTGGVPLFSISRGEKQEKQAKLFMGNTFTLLCLGAVCLIAPFYLYMEPLLYIFGASDASYPYAYSYLNLYLLGTPFIMITAGMNGFINAQGFGRMGMVTILIGAIVNIILDPVFIFVFNLGIAGAAIATVLSQLLSAVWVVWFLAGKKALLKMQMADLKPDAAVIRKILTLGIAGFIMRISNALVQITAITTLGLFGGDIYIGIMTIVNSVREMFSLPLMGLSNAAQPVIGYNYGAGKYNRIKQAVRFLTPICTVYMLFVWLLIYMFPEAIIKIFNSDEDVVTVGAPALRVFFFGIFMMTFHIIGQAVFTGLGKAKQAIFFSLFQKIAIVVPLMLLLPRLTSLGVSGVFWSEPISNFIGATLCFGTMLLTLKKLTLSSSK